MPSLRNSLVLLLLSTSLVLAQTVSEGGDETYRKVREVGEKLKCQCPSGCSYTVTSCNMMGCSGKAGATADIKNMVEAGLQPETIIEQMIAKYGSAARTEPRTEGFGLLGWAMPFVAVLLGLAAAPVVVWHWRSKRKLATPANPMSEEDLQRYRDRIDKDLDQME